MLSSNVSANFGANVTNGRAPLAVGFTDLSVNATGLVWYFGDESYTNSWQQMNASDGFTEAFRNGAVALADGSIVYCPAWNPRNETYRSTDNGETWQLVNASSGWSKRLETYNSMVVLSDGTIVKMGGSYDNTTYFNDTWKSTDKGFTWQLVNASSGWSARANPVAVALPDDSIVLIGGNTDSSLNDVWVSANQGETWELVSASSEWTPRKLHSAVSLPDGSIVLMGGKAASNMNDTWRSTDQGKTWIRVNASSGWGTRHGMNAAAMPDGSIVLLGGITSTDTTLNDVWRSTDKGYTWTRVNSGAFPPRASPSIVMTSDGSLVVMDGFNATYPKDVWSLKPEGSTERNPSHVYTTAGNYSVVLMARSSTGYNSTLPYTFWVNVTEPLVPQTVAGFSANVTSGAAPLAVGFTDLSGNANGWAWYFGDESYTNSWEQMNASDGFSAAFHNGAVALTDGSIVYCPAWNLRNETYRSTDNGATWQLVNASGGWAKRYETYNSMVVLSDDTIVKMGGEGNVSGNIVFYNDTWKSTDKGSTWQLVNASSGWSPRANTVALALPDDSIVLTGGNNGILMNDVWRSTDKGKTWTLMNASSGWTPRKVHTAVSLHDGSIVLMGGMNSSDLNDTWRSTDKGETWSQVNASSGWSVRRGMNAAAMPDDSIVLVGGISGVNNYFNDIWRSTDKGYTWTQVNAHAFSPRASPGLVVTSDGSLVVMDGLNTTYPKDVWRLSAEGSTTRIPRTSIQLPVTFRCLTGAIIS